MEGASGIVRVVIRDRARSGAAGVDAAAVTAVPRTMEVGDRVVSQGETMNASGGRSRVKKNGIPLAEAGLVMTAEPGTGETVGAPSLMIQVEEGVGRTAPLAQRPSGVLRMPEVEL